LRRIASMVSLALALVVARADAFLDGDVVRVAVNQSKLIPLSGRAKTVSIARPEIAQVAMLSPGQIQVSGMAVGSTSLIVWHEGKDPRTMSVLVTPDDVGLRAQLETLFPGERVTVSSAGGSILLSGEVSNEVVYDKVLAVAANYVPPKAPEEVASAGATQAVTISAPAVRLPQTGTAFAGGGQLAFLEEKSLTDTQRWEDKRSIPGLVDMIKIREFRQIEVDVTVAEVSLTKLRETGVDWAVFGKHVGFTSLAGSQAGFSGGPLIGGDVVASPDGISVPFNIDSASAVFSYFSGGISAAAVLRLFENKGAANVLAQPRLLIKNGRSGSFLSGGEFPFPAPQSGGGDNQSITVEFRPFGVRLEFVPTITWSDTIDLKVFPEVSEIDPAASVRVGGITVPGLKVRRSVTRVELRDGETLVIGGLLDRRTIEDLTKFPFLGDVPILGTVFRSTKFRDQETELVFLVTPRVVRPHAPGVMPPIPDYEQKRDPDLRQLPVDPEPMAQSANALVGSARRSTSPSHTPRLTNPPSGSAGFAPAPSY
jgi:pilus assembly protein CpaC